MTPRHLAAWVAALLSLPSTVHALGWPDFVGGLGVATAVQGGEGDNAATPSVSAAMMWPFEEPYRFGVIAFVDDLGEKAGRLTSSAGEDLGPVAGLHRTAWGLGWRAEVHHALNAKYELVGLGTWAYYRIKDDVQGTTTRHNNTTGLGVGIGASRAMTRSQWLGLTLTYRQLWRGLTQRYLTVAAEWRWHRSAAD